jgi:hypothetical protein
VGVFLCVTLVSFRETPYKSQERESYIAAHRVESVGWYGGNVMLGGREIVSFTLVNGLDDGVTHCTAKSKHNLNRVISVLGKLCLTLKNYYLRSLKNINNSWMFDVIILLLQRLKVFS